MCCTETFRSGNDAPRERRGEKESKGEEQDETREGKSVVLAPSRTLLSGHLLTKLDWCHPLRPVEAQLSLAAASLVFNGYKTQEKHTYETFLLGRRLLHF